MIYWDVILKFIYQSFSRISLMLAGLKDSYDICESIKLILTL